MDHVLEPPSDQARDAGRAAENGGSSARRAVVRWSWRLFRREWRQQLLILALVTLAVAAAIVGSAVAINTPASTTSGFGTASDAASFSGSRSAGSRRRSLHCSTASARSMSSRTRRSRSQARSTPFSYGPEPDGAVWQADALAPVGALPEHPRRGGGDERGRVPRLSLEDRQEVAEGGVTRRSPASSKTRRTFSMSSPSSCPDRFEAPTEITVLFNAPGVNPATSGETCSLQLRWHRQARSTPRRSRSPCSRSRCSSSPSWRVGGFTVLAQRRRRSLGMLESIGATDTHVALVVRANGLVTGVVGALLGAAIGLVLWFAYRPQLEQNAHHVIGVLALPWVVVAAAVVLALVATYAAASLPARALRKVSIVAALSGRPATPRQVHRSALPGLGCCVIAFAFSPTQGAPATAPATPERPNSYSGSCFSSRRWSCFAPSCLSLLGRVGGRAPVAIRLALRDLARYRARSGSVLAAISLGVMIAVVITVTAAARYGDVFDYAAPNLASNQLIVGRTPSALAALGDEDSGRHREGPRRPPRSSGSKGQLPISSTRRRPSRPSAAVPSPSQPRSSFEHSGSIHLRSTRTPTS